MGNSQSRGVGRGSQNSKGFCTSLETLLYKEMIVKLRSNVNHKESLRRGYLTEVRTRTG